MALAPETEIICANPDCRVKETGKCVEGFETNRCPHFGHAPTQAVTVSADKSNGLPLPSGGTLNLSETSQVLRAREARVVAIIGPSDAGKTSLIASLYDLFQSAPVAGFEFAGSLSLHEFEHVCHDARAASRRGTPHIARTPRGEVRFYHLDIADDRTNDVLALMLGDRAGEEYRSAIDDMSIVAELPEISRADMLTILVDGERLLDIGARHNLRSDTLMILQALIEGAEVLPRRVAVVLTKLDLLHNSPERTRAEADFHSLVSAIAQTHSGVFSDVASFGVAASPKDDILRRGTGLPELLTYWLSSVSRPTSNCSDVPNSERVFARLDACSENAP